MVSDKANIMALLKTAIEARHCLDFTISCPYWDTMLNLAYGATELNIRSAANLAGYEIVEGITSLSLKYRAA